MKKNNNKENAFKQMFVTRTQGFIDVSGKSGFWKEFANEHNGTFTVKETVAKDLKELILEIPYKKYTVQFTESDTHPLKISCSLNANRKFEFSISFEDAIEKLLKFFGSRDIQTGDDTFDKKYLIKGDEPETIKKVLMKDKIKSIMLSNNVFSFNCTYEKNSGTLQLTSLISRTVNSKSGLSELFELFRLTIDELEKLNII